MEKVKLWTKPGMAKLTGVAICVAGVATLAFYEGPRSKPLFDHNLLESHHQNDHNSSSGTKWVIGCFLFIASVIAWSLWLICQAQVLKSYPAKLSFASLQCLFGAVQCFVIAIAMERDLVEWKLGWDMRLLSVAYGGIVLTSLSYYLQLWVIHKKGPVFLAMSQPLALVMTMIGSVLLLGDVITLGSVLGGILLVISLYVVLWGKSKEQKMEIEESVEAKAAKECREKKEIEGIPSGPQLLV